MEIAVRLQAFEGPLDLLLHLIDKNKVNIYDIPIAEITDQYMAYLQEMKRRDLNIMSEFLVMAATLLDIKARMLLPAEKDEEGEEEDPRQELVLQLLEYKMYKYMSYELRERQQEAGLRMYHAQDMPKEVLAWKPLVRTGELLSGVTLTQMYTVFKDIMRRQADRVDPVRSTFGTLEKEEVDMEQTQERLEEYLSEHKICSFQSLFEGRHSKMQMIIVFLILLEMMKQGRISITQEETFGDIHIEVKDDWRPDAEDEQISHGQDQRRMDRENEAVGSSD